MKRNLKRFLGPIFIVLIVLFFALYLKDIDYKTFAGLSFDWLPLLIATTIAVGFRYWGVVIWRFILRDLGAKILPPFRVLAGVYGKAWMGRYIPGTVTWIAGKIYLASKLGISKSRLTVSSLLEAGVQIVASVSVSLVILGLDPRLDVISAQAKILLIIVAILSVIALSPPIFNRVLRKIYGLIRRKKAYEELSSNFTATARSYVLYAIGALIAGSSYYFLTASLYPAISPSDYWYIVGAFTLSGALGMATPFVPSGLGVRDGAQLVLLSIIMPKEIALAITVASRLWSAVVDVLFYLACHFFEQTAKNRDD